MFVSIPARLANFKIACGYEIASSEETNETTFPHSPQPKHLYITLSGDTTKEGVFSPWKGHKPL